MTVEKVDLILLLDIFEYRTELELCNAELKLPIVLQCGHRMDIGATALG